MLEEVEGRGEAKQRERGQVKGRSFDPEADSLILS